MYSRRLKNSYNLAAVSRLYLLPCAKLRVPSELGFDRELVNRLSKIQTEAEFYILMSARFVGFPPSGGRRNWAHGGKVPLYELLDADKTFFSSTENPSKIFLAKFQVCCTYQHSPGDPYT